jgi:hypothetical protein
MSGAQETGWRGMTGGARSILARNAIEVHNARGAIERIGRLADNLVRVGPFGVGLDGLLTWIPVVGGLYSLGAGAALLGYGLRARVPATSLVQVLAIVLVRSGVGEVPLAGQIAVDLFRGHKWAADLLVRAIDQTLYVDGPNDPASPAYAEAAAQVRAGREKRRVVFLG